MNLRHRMLRSVTKTITSNPLDVSSASYDSVSYFFSEDMFPGDVFFNDDGTKLFYSGSFDRRVYQYTLSTAFDLTSVTYDSVFFSYLNENTVMSSLAFNSNGTKMYLGNGTTKTGDPLAPIYQYTLSTPYNVGTASYDSSFFSSSNEVTSPRGIRFNSSGTKMFLLDTLSQTCYQYTLSTPFSVSSASYDSKSFSFSGQETSPETVTFSSDGLKLLMVGGNTATVYQYTLSTPFDIGSVTYGSVSLPIGSQTGTPISILLSDDDTKMFVLGGDRNLYQYTL